MKICLAQVGSIRGDIQRNIEQHKKMIDHAVTYGADLIIFPELSLTGYHPELANELATDKNDPRFDDFQRISHTKQIAIGVGVPLKGSAGITISMILFYPDQERKVYSKKYLHADEEPFFVSGKNFPVLTIGGMNVALAICYELSVPEHLECALQNDAKIYIASIAKVDRNIDKALERLSAIARQHSMPVLMVNCLGPCDGSEGIGTSSAWDDKGSLIGQLDRIHEGMLILDTETFDVWKEIG